MISHHAWTRAVCQGEVDATLTVALLGGHRVRGVLVNGTMINTSTPSWRHGAAKLTGTLRLPAGHTTVEMLMHRY